LNGVQLSQIECLYERRRIFALETSQILKNQRTNTQTHKHTNTQTHKRTDTQTHKCTNTQTHKRTNTQTHKHTNAQTHKHTNAQTHKHTNTQTHKHTHKHTTGNVKTSACAAEKSILSFTCCIQEAHAHSDFVSTFSLHTTQPTNQPHFQLRTPTQHSKSGEHICILLHSKSPKHRGWEADPISRVPFVWEGVHGSLGGGAWWCVCVKVWWWCVCVCETLEKLWKTVFYGKRSYCSQSEDFQVN